MLKFLFAYHQQTPTWWLHKVAREIPASGCNMLIFGLGYDSLFYATSNSNGFTQFIEHDQKWIDKFPSLNVHHYEYQTKYSEGVQEIKVDLPIYETFWDVVLIDGPPGWGVGTPGRTSPIYSVSLMQANHIFIDDYERELERACCERFLGKPLEVIGSKYAHYVRI